jgi:hypothetical protein
MMATNQKQINLDSVGRGEGSQQHLKSNGYCPKTGKQVGQQGGQNFLLPGGQATWWHCPACGGWHVILQK